MPTKKIRVQGRRENPFLVESFNANLHNLPLDEQSTEGLSRSEGNKTLLITCAGRCTSRLSNLGTGHGCTYAEVLTGRTEERGGKLSKAVQHTDYCLQLTATCTMYDNAQ
eukprot:6178652-Pleurochrysis_carterae.AAC.5